MAFMMIQMMFLMLSITSSALQVSGTRSDEDAVSNSDIITELRKLMKKVSVLTSKVSHIENDIGGMKKLITKNGDSIQKLNSRISVVEKDVKKNEGAIKGAHNMIRNVESIIVVMTKGIKKNENDIKRVNTRITTFSSKLTNLNKTIVQEEDCIKGLNTKIVSLTSKVDGISKVITKDMAEVTSKISSVKTDIGSIHKVITKDEGDITALRSQVSSAGKSMSVMQKGIVRNQDDIKVLKKKMAELHVTTRSPPTTQVAPTTQVQRTTESSQIYYPPGTRDHALPRCYPYIHRLCFVGYGVGHYSRVRSNHNLSFERCVSSCRNQREHEGNSWNGIFYRWSDRRCQCVRGDYGHIPTDNMLHYRFSITTTAPLIN